MVVTGLEGQARLDRVLRRLFPEWGRQAVQRLIGGRTVQVNGRTVWLASWLVANGDRITIAEAPAAKPAPFVQFEEAWLIAADADLVVVDKPAGLLAEAPPHRDAPNLHALAVARFGPLTLFHRLDRDTSGVMVLTRTRPMNQLLATAFQQHTITKVYVAVVHAPNRLASTGTIETYIGDHPTRRDMMAVVARGGQRAVTDYRVERSLGDRQWVRLWPRTGRTHQLRIHLAAMGAPILGDRLYGDPGSAPRLLLHAERLSIPALDGAVREFVASPPREFLQE